MTRKFLRLRRIAALPVAITLLTAPIASAQSPEAAPPIAAPANTALLSPAAFARLIRQPPADVAAVPVVEDPRRSREPQQTQSAQAANDDPRWPIFMAGWTFQSITRNSVVANVILSRREGGKDSALWRGLQATTVVGRRGCEVGVGYGWFQIAQIPLGYEFRAVAGRPWIASGRLAPNQWYVGGEAAAVFAWFRATVGMAVPVGAVRSHRPVVTGSFGIVTFLTKWPKRPRPARR